MKAKYTWSYLAHLSTNMWYDRPPERFETVYRKIRGLSGRLLFSEHVWQEWTNRMQELGMNQVVIDVGDGPVEMVNPKILAYSGEQGGMEGCLSFPGQSGYVVRPNYVKVQAYDRHGDLYEYEGEELFARAVFHECDHLDGKVYLRLVTDPPEGFEE